MPFRWVPKILRALWGERVPCTCQTFLRWSWRNLSLMTGPRHPGRRLRPLVFLWRMKTWRQQARWSHFASWFNRGRVSHGGSNYHGIRTHGRKVISVLSSICPFSDSEVGERVISPLNHPRGEEFLALDGKGVGGHCAPGLSGRLMAEKSGRQRYSPLWKAKVSSDIVRQGWAVLLAVKAVLYLCSSEVPSVSRPLNRSQRGDVKHPVFFSGPWFLLPRRVR